MSHRSTVADLESLVLSFHSLIVIETVEEERVRGVLAEVAGDLRLPMYEWSVTVGLSRLGHPPVGATTDPLAMLRHIAALDVEAIFQLKDLAPHLQKPEAGRGLRDLTQKLTSTRSAIVLTGDPVELPRDLDGLAVRYIVPLPDEQELREIVRRVVEAVGARQKVEVDLSRDEARSMFRALAGLTASQARQVVAQAIIGDGKLTVGDVERIIRCKGELIERGGVLEFHPVESSDWQLGGFGRLKEWLDAAQVGFSPEARALNLEAPKGVLLVGVQGCGKSLTARYIARQWGVPLLKLDTGRLYDKYIGESEKNFRKATAIAEAMAPVVLWIDEIEKVFAQGGSGEADGGLSARLFGAFLTWLQEKKQEVFVVAAANDVMGLPPELLRKGRFDEIFFVDLPDLDERRHIYEIHLGLRKQEASSFDLEVLAEAADGYSGAEIEQTIVAALYRALQRKQSLTTAGLLESVRATVPLSVSRREDLEELRRMARGRFTPVR
jgi:hypothetical protein